MNEGEGSPCVEPTNQKELREDDVNELSSTRETTSATTENVNSTTPVEQSGRADKRDTTGAYSTQQNKTVEGAIAEGNSGMNLAEGRGSDESDEDEDDDIVVTRRKLGSESEASDEELTNGTVLPRGRGLLHKKASESLSDEKGAASLETGEEGNDLGEETEGEDAATGDVPGDDNEYWDEEDELAKYIASREKEAGSPPGAGGGNTDGAFSDDAAGDDDNDLMNENLIEDDLDNDDDDECQAEAKLADPGDKLGGDWTPEVKPIDDLLQKLQQKHQQTVMKAKELLDKREDKKREKVRADFERISKMLAEEDIERNSEDECDQLEIVPDDPNAKSDAGQASIHSYDSDGGNSDFELDGFESDRSEHASEGHDASEVDVDNDDDDDEREEISVKDDGAVEEVEEPSDSIANGDQREGGYSPNPASASSPMLVDGPPLENEDTVETAPDQQMSGPLADENQGDDLEDGSIDSDRGGESILEDDASAGAGPSNGASQNSGDSDTGEPSLNVEGGNLKRKHPGTRVRSAFVEHEAEMSDDEGHTDDEIEDGMDEELAEFLRGEKDIVDDPRKQDGAHKKWEDQNDMKVLRDVVRGIRGGWRKKRRKKNHHALEDDDDDGSIDGARRRRVANVSESDSDQENEVRHRNRNIDSSDDDSIGSGSQGGLDMGEEDLVDDLIAGLDVFDPVGAMESGKGRGESKTSKAVDALMETLISSDVADMVDLTDMETQPHNPPEGQYNSPSMVSFGQKRSRGGQSNTDNPRTVDNLLTAQRGSIWDMEDGGSCSIAPKQSQRNETPAAPSKDAPQKDRSKEGSILLSMLGN
ncbi:hypothetical protein BSKO_08201 [Bryopsis sp. KO-2023]|nr:hypothetical protein BSKO_08201 [Bryopsis sp. KO-2023]